MKLVNRLKREDGVILVAVIAMTIVMSILAIALMSISSSAVIANQKQIDRIKAEMLATGAFWQTYMSRANGGAVPASVTQVLDGKSFTATISSATGGPNNTTSYNSTVSY